VTERRRDAVRTRTEILDAATREFADRGLAGARIDEIADRTRTTKRMIYYYFGSKAGLYLAVLEKAYAEIHEVERAIDVADLSPVEAVRRLAERTFDHHTGHPDFVRLVSIENIHRAEHLAASDVVATLRQPVLDQIEQILRRGREQGVFRDDVEPVQVHMLISACAIFPVANRHTFKAIFDHDLLDVASLAEERRMLGDMVVAYLTAGATG
jgi:AcrR family transcriptional regulator